MNVNYLCLLMVLMTGCIAPKIETQITQAHEPLEEEAEVVVLIPSDPSPQEAEVIGSFRISDESVLEAFEWHYVKSEAKRLARNSGGNVIRLLNVQLPGDNSPSYQIQGMIMRADSLEKVKTLQGERPPKVDSTWDYAVLHVYRADGLAPLLGFDLYLGDSVICRVKNKTLQQVKIKKEGLTRLWAKTEALSEVPIDIEHGREYYLMCKMRTGIVVGRPELSLVEKEIAEEKFTF